MLSCLDTKTDKQTDFNNRVINNRLQLLFNRMDAIDAQCKHNHFPLYSIGTSDHWTTSRGGSWTGGFWAGCWWLRSLITQSTNDEKKALAICQHLNG